VKGLIVYGAIGTIVLFASILTLTGVGWPQSALANKISHLTFSHPVQVPGATLPSGTYTFSLSNQRNLKARITRGPASVITTPKVPKVSALKA